MWMLPPEKMCRNHLLGEHKELHMLIGCMRKNKSIKGYMERKQLQLNAIFSRHEEIVAEMLKRGYKHNTPVCKEEITKLIYGNIDYYFYQGIEVDTTFNKKDLYGRCELCGK